MTTSGGPIRAAPHFRQQVDMGSVPFRHRSPVVSQGRNRRVAAARTASEHPAVVIMLDGQFGNFPRHDGRCVEEGLDRLQVGRGLVLRPSPSPSVTRHANCEPRGDVSTFAWYQYGIHGTHGTLFPVLPLRELCKFRSCRKRVPNHSVPSVNIHGTVISQVLPSGRNPMPTYHVPSL